MTTDSASLDRLRHQALSLARCLVEAAARPAMAEWWLVEARIAHHRLGVLLGVETTSEQAR